MHMPERHGSVLKINQLIHSEGFWAVVAITMIFLTLMLIAWWGSVSTIAPLPDYYQRF